MKLEASERAALIELLSDLVGSYDTVHTLRRVRGMVGFTPDEMGRLKEDPKAALDMAKDIHLDDWTISFIHDGLVALDQAERLHEKFLSLYDKFVTVDRPLPAQDEATAARLQELRDGLKTVALVGMSPRSCSLAPFNNSEVELWSCNEAHAFSWMTRATRWFQVHTTYKQNIAKRGVRGHFEWLKKNPWGIPIYTQHEQPDVKGSVPYPLKDVCEKFLGGIRRGEEKIKYFNSSFDYMMGVALLERFERIEIYGFDMAGDNEYAVQKPSAEFWIGVASGMGTQIYLPDGCLLLKSSLYGEAEQGEGWQ